MTVGVDFDHLVEVFVRFLHCEVTFSPLQLSSLEENNCAAHI